MPRVLFFFFSSRRRHTRLQGDWSSDVCSSDLGGAFGPLPDRKMSRLNPEATTQRPISTITWLIVWGWREKIEEHTSELQSPCNLVCRLLLEKKKQNQYTIEYVH